MTVLLQMLDFFQDIFLVCLAMKTTVTHVLVGHLG